MWAFGVAFDCAPWFGTSTSRRLFLVPRRRPEPRDPTASRFPFSRPLRMTWISAGKDWAAIHFPRRLVREASPKWKTSFILNTWDAVDAVWSHLKQGLLMQMFSSPLVSGFISKRLLGVKIFHFLSWLASRDFAFKFMILPFGKLLNIHCWHPQCHLLLE